MKPTFILARASFLLRCLLAMTLSTSVLAQQLARPLPFAKDTAKVSYEDEINAWHALHISKMKAGYLSTVSRQWLKEGKNVIEPLGTLTLDKRTVILQVNSGVEATVGGKPFSSGVIRTEKEQQKVVVGSRTYVVRTYGPHLAVTASESNKEMQMKLGRIPRFPVSRQWRIEARWEPYASLQPIKLTTLVPDFLTEYQAAGIAIFSIDGKEYKLEAVKGDLSDLIFAFTDQTNGTETYGGGRFVFADLPKAGPLVIDFNKAFNPPCAVNPYLTCPLPQKANHLPVRIEVGEKKVEEN